MKEVPNKQRIAQHFDRIAPKRRAWFEANWRYHRQIYETCKLFLTPQSRVLELGCSTGDLLARLEPAYGVGIDISPASIEQARRQYPHLTWICGDVEALPEHAALQEPFDVIIAEDLLGYVGDVQELFVKLRPLTHSGTRLVVSCWNWLWEPILRLGEVLGLKVPDLPEIQNWISASAVENLLELADYKTLQKVPGILLPYDIPVITPLINALSYAPVFDHLTLLTIVVACPLPVTVYDAASVSIIIPTRNEVGNIAALAERVPELGTHTELIFVDGNSTDGTIEEIHRQIALHPERDIRFIPQVAPHDPHADAPPDMMLKLGKGDAVRKGFAAAKGDILIIQDSDISVDPEELCKFYEVLAKGQARMANGTRFIYAQEQGAMRALNRLGNVFFSLLFSWMLGQRITDTLCGTKGLRKQDYEAIAANRHHFGDFDPFGDFDLLFGAAWLGYRILDIPVPYKARTYGESKVRIGTHGPLLGRMSLIAFWHFKLKPLITGKHRQGEESSSLSSLLLGAALVAIGWFWSKLRKA